MDFRSGSPSDNSGAEEMEVSMTKPKHKVVSEHSRNNNIFQVVLNVDKKQPSTHICSHNNYTGCRCGFWRKQLSELSRYQEKPAWVCWSSEFRCPYCVAFKASSGLELVCLFSWGMEPEIIVPDGLCDCINSLQACAKILQWICRTQGGSSGFNCSGLKVQANSQTATAVSVHSVPRARVFASGTALSECTGPAQQWPFIKGVCARGDLCPAQPFQVSVFSSLHCFLPPHGLLFGFPFSKVFPSALVRKNRIFCHAHTVFVDCTKALLCVLTSPLPSPLTFICLFQFWEN